MNLVSLNVFCWIMENNQFSIINETESMLFKFIMLYDIRSLIIHLLVSLSFITLICMYINVHYYFLQKTLLHNNILQKKCMREEEEKKTAQQAITLV